MNLSKIASRIAADKSQHTIMFEFAEPDEETIVYTADLSNEELNQLKQLFTELQEKAGDNWGDTLAAWSIDSVDSAEAVEHFTNFPDLLNDIALNSRYNETDTPGEFYGGSIALLEGR
jgi:hypothetical protein